MHKQFISRATATAPYHHVLKRVGLALLFYTVAILATIMAATAWGEDAYVLPAPGKLAGFVSKDAPGKWIIFGPNGFKAVVPLVVNEGRAVVWQGDAGEYAVIYLPPGDAQPEPITVILGGKAPTPPPGPTPAPLSAIAEAVRVAATSAPAAQREAVAASFDGVSAQIAAGTLKDAAAIIAATREANQKAVGDAKESWLPFFEVVRKLLNDEASAGRLATPEAHQATWDQISIGVRAAK